MPSDVGVLVAHLRGLPDGLDEDDDGGAGYGDEDYGSSAKLA